MMSAFGVEDSRLSKAMSVPGQGSITGHQQWSGPEPPKTTLKERKRENRLATGVITGTSAAAGGVGGSMGAGYAVTVKPNRQLTEARRRVRALADATTTDTPPDVVAQRIRSAKRTLRAGIRIRDQGIRRTTKANMLGGAVGAVAGGAGAYALHRKKQQ